MFPGSAYTPTHSVRRRVAYGCMGIFIGCAATFTNALVNVNAGNLAGSLGLTLAQVSVLPAIYVAMNATANLTLVRARARFGIPEVTLVLLGLYALAALVAVDRARLRRRDRRARGLRRDGGGADDVDDLLPDADHAGAVASACAGDRHQPDAIGHPARASRSFRGSGDRRLARPVADRARCGACSRGGDPGRPRFRPASAARRSSRSIS